MGVAWGLADPGRNGFDYLESLQAIGQNRGRDLQNQSDAMRLADMGARQQARPGIQAQVQSGDLEGAQSAALAAGDFDMAKAIADMSDDHRKRLEGEGVIIGRAAGALKRVPVEQRRQVFQGMIPRLRQYGIGAEELAGVSDFSDDTLDQFVALSQSINDGLTGRLTQRRIEDVGEDNERADLLAGNTVRNTDNVIADRAARRGLTARGQDLADNRGRYATDVASRDRRRGQDIGSADRRRGQDRPPASRPPRSTGGGGGGIVRVQTPQEAAKLAPGTRYKTPDGRMFTR